VAESAPLLDVFRRVVDRALAMPTARAATIGRLVLSASIATLKPPARFRLRAQAVVGADGGAVEEQWTRRHAARAHLVFLAADGQSGVPLSTMKRLMPSGSPCAPWCGRRRG
jgi:hypothetical protein